MKILVFLFFMLFLYPYTSPGDIGKNESIAESYRADVQNGACDLKKTYDFFSDLETQDVKNWLSEQSQRYSDFLSSSSPETGTLLTTIEERSKFYSTNNLPTRLLTQYGELDFSQNHVALIPANTNRPLILVDITNDIGTGAVLASTSLSPDGQKLAFAVSYGGTDVQFWRFVDLRERAILADRPIRIRLVSLKWSSDSSGVIYTVWPDMNTETENAKTGRAPHLGIAYHRLDTEGDQDEVLFRDSDSIPSTLWAGYDLKPGEVYLAFHDQTWVRTEARILMGRRKKDGIYWKPLLIGRGKYLQFLGGEKDEAFFAINLPDGRFAVRSFKLSRPPNSRWKTLFAPPKGSQLDNYVVRAGRYWLTAFLDAKLRPEVQLFTLEGKHVLSVNPSRDFGLPEWGQIRGMKGSAKSSWAYFTFGSPGVPTVPFRIKLDDSILPTLASVERVGRSIPNPLDQNGRSLIHTEFVKFRSFDGKEIPLHLSYRADLSAPPSFVFMNYYGAIGSIETPYFSAGNVAIFELGGAVALVNARGGGEYGMNWTLPADKDKGVTVKDIAFASRYLQKRFGISGDKIAGEGSSYGGLHSYLLAMLYPDDFGALSAESPLSDLPRDFRHNKIAWGFVGDVAFARNRLGEVTHYEERMQELQKFSPMSLVCESKRIPYLFTYSSITDERTSPEQGYFLQKQLLTEFGPMVHSYLFDNGAIGHTGGGNNFAEFLAFVAAKSGATIKPFVFGPL